MAGAPVAQPAEAVGLKPTQCGFEPRRGHKGVACGHINASGQVDFPTGY